MMRFAIVDDEPNVPEQIAEMLKTYVPDVQIETNCFHQPSDFLEMYYSCNYDAVFLDIDMPAINGFDLSQKIYEKNNSVPIVYITSRDDLIIHAFRYKPLGFVRKPVYCVGTAVCTDNDLKRNQPKKSFYHYHRNEICRWQNVLHTD